MRAIQKGPEPASLSQHRCSEHADYGNYADKDVLRRHLVAEQRGLCCYCLSRIRPERGAMKVAHWHPQATHPDEQLDYANLLAACLGNEGQPLSRQHCDTRQRNREISRNPADPAHRVDDMVRFTADGRMTSDDPVFEHDLDDVLNLNEAFLVENRKAVLDAFTALLRKRGELQRTTLQRMLREWNGDDGRPLLEPFCQGVVYWLRKRLRRA